MTMRTKLFCITLASMLLLSLIGRSIQAVSDSSIAAANSAGVALLSSRFEQVDLSNALSYPTDPTADIPWSAGTNGVADIQAAFNHARTVENSQLGTSIPMMTLPSQTTWSSMSDGQKALWLINRERVDRGVAPLQGLESNVGGVAQYYADYLLDNNTWGHTADGRDPWQRLDDNPAIGACHDFLSVSENLAVFVTSGSSIPLPIERTIYMWMYEDGNCCGWGHRHAILWYPYNDNSGPAGSEGFLGIGRANGGPYQGPFSQSWPFAEIIVMNVFDPCMNWTSAFPPQTLSVSKSGTGTGTVNSNPAGINCGSDCSEQYDYDTVVTLTASPAAGSVFTGWSGACAGPGSCIVSMTTARSVTASFVASNTSGVWQISGQGAYLYGTTNDIPVPADYNGDGRDDLAIFRESNSTWYVYGVGPFQYGTTNDIPVIADYNGDGKDDVAVFRESNSTWYVYGVGPFQYGTTNDIPVVADYNGDGKDDIAVFRPSNSTWYIRGVGSFLYGTTNDIPVIGDYNGDGRADIAVFRPSNSTWYIRGVGPFVYGTSGDIPVVADYNGDSKADIAVFRPSNGTWYIRGSGSFVYGSSSHRPVPADYNGDGKADIAVFRP